MRNPYTGVNGWKLINSKSCNHRKVISKFTQAAQSASFFTSFFFFSDQCEDFSEAAREMVSSAMISTCFSKYTGVFSSLATRKNGIHFQLQIRLISDILMYHHRINWLPHHRILSLIPFSLVQTGLPGITDSKALLPLEPLVVNKNLFPCYPRFRKPRQNWGEKLIFWLRII